MGKRGVRIAIVLSFVVLLLSFVITVACVTGLTKTGAGECGCMVGNVPVFVVAVLFVGFSSILAGVLWTMCGLVSLIVHVIKAKIYWFLALILPTLFATSMLFCMLISTLLPVI